MKKQSTIDIPFPTQIFQTSQDAVCILNTTLDLALGFHQLEVEKADIPTRAFSFENNHYEFLRRPFGSKNAPSTCQRVMDNVFGEHIGVICLVYRYIDTQIDRYIDDIIVFTTSLTELLNNFDKMFATLQKYNLKIQLD